MYYENQALKSYARTNGVFSYEIAEKLGISESAFSKELRKPLSPERKDEIRKTIDLIAISK